MQRPVSAPSRSRWSPSHSLPRPAVRRAAAARPAARSKVSPSPAPGRRSPTRSTSNGSRTSSRSSPAPRSTTRRSDRAAASSSSRAKTVDFGASDAPLQSDEIAALPGPYIEIPTVLGGVVVAYNVSGVDSGPEARRRRPSAKIFLGEITKWNDPAIASLNPGVTLPDTPISVVHRSDESGTTFVFTSWLSSQSSAWENKVGADKAVSWPTGTGGDGNDGVAAGDHADGRVDRLPLLRLRGDERPRGRDRSSATTATFVAPSVDSISKAGGDLSFPIEPDHEHPRTRRRRARTRSRARPTCSCTQDRRTRTRRRRSSTSSPGP